MGAKIRQIHHNRRPAGQGNAGELIGAIYFAGFRAVCEGLAYQIRRADAFRNRPPIIQKVLLGRTNANDNGRAGNADIRHSLPPLYVGIAFPHDIVQKHPSPFFLSSVWVAPAFVPHVPDIQDAAAIAALRYDTPAYFIVNPLG